MEPADSLAYSQEPPLISIFSVMNQVQNLTISLLRIQLDIIIPTTSWSHKWPIKFKYSDYNFALTSHITTLSTSPSHLFLLLAHSLSCLTLTTASPYNTSSILSTLDKPKNQVLVQQSNTLTFKSEYSMQLVVSIIKLSALSHEQSQSQDVIIIYIQTVIRD
jgi:hypothetical protein